MPRLTPPLPGWTIRPLVACVFALAWGPSAASAADGWQWTDWGMSEAEVVGRAPIELRPIHNMPQQTTIEDRLIGIYRAAGIDFTASFGFMMAQGLAQITLAPVKSANCALTKLALTAQYGAPLVSDVTPISSIRAGELITRWESKDDYAVSFSTALGGCSILYTPEGPSNDGGL